MAIESNSRTSLSQFNRFIWYISLARTDFHVILLEIMHSLEVTPSYTPYQSVPSAFLDGKSQVPHSVAFMFVGMALIAESIDSNHRQAVDSAP